MGDDHMTAVIDGPAWSAPGLVPHDNRYPLKVETAVQRAVSLLLPGVSTASELITPASRFSGSEGLSSIGLVGRPVRLGQSPPPAVQELLAAVGTDPATLLSAFTETVG